MRLEAWVSAEVREVFDGTLPWFFADTLKDSIVRLFFALCQLVFFAIIRATMALPDPQNPSSASFDHVNYDALDAAKRAFIEAGKRTREFAKEFGYMPESGFGSSANVFNLDLKPFLKVGASELQVTLLPEGLGTSDDARPEDLTEKELQTFWYNIGVKTVAVMTNDAAASGMQTVLISLYLPSSTPELVFNRIFMKGFLDGFVEGCRQVGCVYFSGETPQLKGKIVPGKLDIAGALFGLVPPGMRPIDGRELGAGDTIVFIESSGPHDNGFTTLRALAEKLPEGYRTKIGKGIKNNGVDENSDLEYWQAINAPTILYTRFVQDLMRADIGVTNLEPITGHGWMKIMRSKKPLRYVIDTCLPVPPIFEFVERETGMSKWDMLKVFNYGVGLAVFVKSAEDALRVVSVAEVNGLKACVAGKVEDAKMRDGGRGGSGKREVVVKPLDVILSEEEFSL